MPYKEKTVEKLYWSIGEVASELDVNASLIRYWEKEFGMVKPKRTGRGDRLYTRKDIELLKRIKHLVKQQGFTLNGAREAMKRNVSPAEDPLKEVRSVLLSIRTRLLALQAVPEEQKKS